MAHVSQAADDEYRRIRATPEFAELKKAHTSFVIPMTIAFMIWYLTYVVMSNWATGFMNIQLFGNINVALVFGLLQFVTTFGIAYWYSKYSARTMDPLSDQLREQYEREVDR